MTPPVVLLVGPAAERALVGAELEAPLTGLADLLSCDAEEAALRHAVGQAGDALGLVLLCADARAVDDQISELDELLGQGPSLPPVILLTTRPHHADLHRSLDAGRLRAVVPIPWAPGGLTTLVRVQLARWLRHRDPDHPLLARLDVDDRPAELPSSRLLHDLELDEHRLAQQLVRAIDRALGQRPRITLPPGVRLTRQDADVDGLLVVLRGSVALDRRTPIGELRLHHGSTGPIVGLLSLVQQRRAFFTARTTTEVEAIHLSVEQLDLALHREAEVGTAMTAATVQALARRLRRSEQLQLEKRELADELAATRLDLVESARMATLGELAAGVAHELNNPVAALVRASSHLADDLATLLGDHPAAADLLERLAAARGRAPRSTADERAARRELTDLVGDGDLARRLVAAGVTDATEAGALLERHGGLPASIEAAAGLGGALRNLEVSAARIAELVDSLRAYARPTAEPTPTDVGATLDDTLRIVAHRLEGVEVQREVDTVPPVRAHPGQLGQVWTNLIVNAVEAMGGRGTLRVALDQPDEAHVRVRISDDGPGISPEVAARMFEPRFTTKRGTVRYGLGLGLAITKRIVTDHGGTIDVDSVPGATTLTVVLPIAGPAGEEQP